MPQSPVVLGLFAGLTILLGLPIARWDKVTERVRGLLTLGSVGVLLFLIIEVGYHAMEGVESTVISGVSGSVRLGIVFILGFALGLVGLAGLEEARARHREGGASPLHIATMIAIGIGLHNFAEGLAIGQSFASGAAALGTLLVVGFALHNATEGFGIAAPLAGEHPSWARLLGLGLIGGGPTALGTIVGTTWVSPTTEVLFLSLATGSLIYVTRELLRLRFGSLGSVAAMTAVTVGLLAGFGTELIAEVAMSSATPPPPVTAQSVSVQFANLKASPGEIQIPRGETLSVTNGETVPVVIEGNGLFVGEIAVAPGEQTSVQITGKPGGYRLAPERGTKAVVSVTVLEGTKVDSDADQINAIGALTILEGHIRASKELHERGVSGQGPDPVLDLKRSGVHAGHPLHELLEGGEPDALNLQRLLHDANVFDPLKEEVTRYVDLAPHADTSSDALGRQYADALTATERARKAIGGAAWDDPKFRARVAIFVLDTAIGEYTSATEGDRITVLEPAKPGKDNFIEYQDARAFIAAARDLLGANIPPATATALDHLIKETFAPLDPADPEHPVPIAEVQRWIDQAKLGLGE